jgi:hypothetical protein
MTASFNRRRLRNRSNEAAIAGVMLRPNRIGNSEEGEFCFFVSGEVPLPPGEALGEGGEALAGASTRRGGRRQRSLQPPSRLQGSTSLNKGIDRFA